MPENAKGNFDQENKRSQKWLNGIKLVHECIERKRNSLKETQMDVIKGNSFESGLELVAGMCAHNMCAFVPSKEIQRCIEALTIALWQHTYRNPDMSCLI